MDFSILVIPITYMQDKVRIRKIHQSEPAIVIDFKKKEVVDPNDELKKESKSPAQKFPKPKEPEQYIKCRKHDFL
jgi:hypothetical protein